jgi:arylsulfatase B
MKGMSAVLLRTLLPAALLATARPAAAAKPPNHVIFFLVDDYGFADASYKKALYPDKHLNPPPTPFLDQLAKAGVMLESYYVNKLCSPTRTALLSGRYAYTIGMDDGVIVDGTANDLPLNLLTIADRLQQAGWNTSAYGKWDAGMTVWGSTPTCRGFDHFNGFYSAASQCGATESSYTCLPPACLLPDSFHMRLPGACSQLFHASSGPGL